MNYHIRYVKAEDEEEVMNIYQSLIGTAGCTWNSEYPSMEDVRMDTKNSALYCMVDENSYIIAVAAADDDCELNHLTCWKNGIKRWCDLKMVAVKKNMQNQGLGKILVSYIIDDVKKRGFDGMRMIVGKANSSALALYNQLHFKCCGDTYMYGIHWFCYEMEINKC